MLFSFQSPVFPLRFAFPPFEGGEGGMFLCVRSFVIQSVSEESPFSHFWLDSKVTQRSRLRALHTPSRCLQVGKSGNSLRFGQPDFLSPCSLLRRLTARGPLTNTEAFEARFLTAFGMTKGSIQIIIHSGFQPSAEGVALFPNASLRCTLG